MQKKSGILIISLLIVLLFAGCAGTGSAETKTTVKPTATTKAENTDSDVKYITDFTVNTTKGSFTLSKALITYDYVFINLWGSTCKPCKREMPILQKMYEKYGDRVAFISLSAYTGDTMEDAEEEAKTFGLQYPVGLAIREILSLRSRSAVPYFMLIDKNMKVVWEFIGSRGSEDLYTDLFSKYLK